MTRQSLTSSRLLVLALACTIGSVVCIAWIDPTLARWIERHDLHGDVWTTGIEWLEYATGIEPWKWAGVCVLVGAVIATLALPRWQPFAPGALLVAATHLAGRNVMFWMKPGLGRLRPHEWLGKRDTATFFRDGVSFPSGHVILFASLALPAAVAWPRLRVPAAILIAYVMCARVAANAHFLSDVFGGLAVTALLTWACAWVIDRLPIPPASLR